MIRVLIVTPVRLIGDLLQVVCSSQADLSVVGCVSDKAQALANKARCDVMLVSHSLENNGALSLLQAAGRPTTPFPAIVIIGLPNVEPLILRYLEAGATGCVREQDSSDDLVRAIRLAAARHVALTADLFPVVLKRVSSLAMQQREAALDGLHLNDKNLTTREREILQLIARGYGNREIAQQLTIALGTAKNHVHNILDKLSVKTRRDAAIYYTLSLV
ncbi:MAG TPA: response regulator transcription factor [Anaerolineae bacterium]|nr:response regulator transcription factor [Anaerolineae bacterium]